MAHATKKLWRLLLVLPALYLLLLIPDRRTNIDVKPSGEPFIWNRDVLWESLENNFINVRKADTMALDHANRLMFERLAGIVHHNSDFTAKQYADSILPMFFSLSSSVAVRPSYTDTLINLYSLIRNHIKEQSQGWNMNDVQVRKSLYQLLYGMRAGVEECLLQKDSLLIPPAIFVKEEPSATPSATIFGITVHSGDLLVSRGGAEVSALISRGNDYPGNFSHVALIYVDDIHVAHLIEAHIEKGAAISTVAEYERDKKLRFMVMRPRAGLAALKGDPMLPQKAARYVYQQVLSRHIPYDFKMDYKDSTALFCSEVGAMAYAHQHIDLWQGLSTISSPGITNWLQAFGVEHFVTQMPSDLEYDPQLSVVAEWRDGATLLKDHIDNAVMDVLLEKADAGMRIRYDWWQLPLARCLKGWSMLKNMFGKPGIVPEGMTATQALKNQYFVKIYNKLRNETMIAVQAFRSTNHYMPPYWQMTRLARKAAENL